MFEVVMIRILRHSSKVKNKKWGLQPPFCPDNSNKLKFRNKLNSNLLLVFVLSKNLPPGISRNHFFIILIRSLWLSFGVFVPISSTNVSSRGHQRQSNRKAQKIFFLQSIQYNLAVYGLSEYRRLAGRLQNGRIHFVQLRHAQRPVIAEVTLILDIKDQKRLFELFVISLTPILDIKNQKMLSRFKIRNRTIY